MAKLGKAKKGDLVIKPRSTALPLITIFSGIFFTVGIMVGGTLLQKAYRDTISSYESMIRESATTMEEAHNKIVDQATTIEGLQTRVKDLESTPLPDEKKTCASFIEKNKRLSVEYKRALSGIDHLQCALQNARTGRPHLCEE